MVNHKWQQFTYTQIRSSQTLWKQYALCAKQHVSSNAATNTYIYAPIAIEPRVQEQYEGCYVFFARCCLPGTYFQNALSIFRSIFNSFKNVIKNVAF